MDDSEYNDRREQYELRGHYVEFCTEVVVVDICPSKVNPCKAIIKFAGYEDYETFFSVN